MTLSETRAINMAVLEKEKLKIFLETAGAAAVVLGLIFVGVELRQNTAAVQAATFQSLTDSSSNFILTIASDADLTRAWTLGGSNLEQLDESDSVRYFLIMRSFWIRMQNVFSQWKRGTLSDEDWQLYSAIVCGSGGERDGIDGLMISFDHHTHALSAELIEFIRGCWKSQ